MHLYADISKSEAQADGTLKVWGYASSEAVDSQDEMISAEAMKAALPDYMKFGAVREMHQPMAAGTAIEASVKADGRTWFGAHIVDPLAVKKIQTQVYKGFSIGGKVTSRDTMNKALITGLRLTEISLVDRPANPDSVFELWKADMTPTTDTQDDQAAAVDKLAEIINKGEITPAQLVALAEAAKALPAVDADIVKAANPVITPVQVADPVITPEVVVAKAADPVITPAVDTVEKSMYDVQNFADVLQTLSYMCGSSVAEATAEGDNSAVPAKLNAWLKSGIAIFQAMSIEESNELVSSMQDSPMYLAGQTAGLEKAGARNSAKDTASIQKAHDATVAAGAACAPMDKAAPVDDLQKSDSIEKMGDALKKVLEANAELAKRIKALEDTPEPARGKLIVVSKGEDIGAVEDSPAPEAVVKQNDGSINTVASALKKVHQSGGQHISRM